MVGGQTRRDADWGLGFSHSDLSLPQLLFTAVLRVLIAGCHEEIIRKAIQIGKNLGIYRFFLVESNNVPLGAAADGTSMVKVSSRL